MQIANDTCYKQYLCSSSYNFDIRQSNKTYCMLQENTPLVHRLQQRYLPIFPSKTYLLNPPEQKQKQQKNF